MGCLVVIGLAIGALALVAVSSQARGVVAWVGLLMVCVAILLLVRPAVQSVTRRGGSTDVRRGRGHRRPDGSDDRDWSSDDEDGEADERPPATKSDLGCAALILALIVALAWTVLGSGTGGRVGLTESLIVAANVGILVAIVAAGVVAARWALRRLGDGGGDSDSTDTLIEAAGRVQDGDYSARVPETGSAESRLLARSFNQMSARLGATDAQRRSFMADVSHELRTPLTVIQGQLEAIRDGVYPADAEHLAPALDQVAVLERLVEDLRTLALSESGSLKLTRESVDVGALATEVVGAFEPSARAAGVHLAVTVAPAVPRAWLDPTRVGSVVRNLVANALRYTPAGGSVTVEVAAAGPDEVLIRVRDTGRGIDPALLATVFERFSRSPDSTGSGLGLAIARALVEAHGGTITAASDPGSGTTMTVRLPVGSI